MGYLWSRDRQDDSLGLGPLTGAVVAALETPGLPQTLAGLLRQVAAFTLKGHSAESAGQILGISPGTVRLHRRSIYSKLRINSQGELFSRFLETLAEMT